MLYVKLSLVLALVAGLASGVLAATYQFTAPEIKKAKEEEKGKALGAVFFNGFERSEEVKKETASGTVEYFKVYVKGDTTEPSYFATTGKGIGYNKSVPIELLVGFENPAKAAAKADPEKDGLVCYNWKVLLSVETPGLGENAKDTKPTFTLAGKLSGQADDTSADRRTDFQRQFSGKPAQTMEVKKNIDIITGSTYSTIGITNAVKDADKRLREALAAR